MKKLVLLLGVVALVLGTASCGSDYEEIESNLDQIETTYDPGDGNEGGDGEGSGGPGGVGG